MPEEAETRIKLLERALKLDPTYALARASMSGALEARYIRGGSNPADARPKITLLPPFAI